MDDTKVKVAVRVRPQSAREVLDMCQVCSHIVPGEPQIVLGNDKSFTFDYVFDTGTSQVSVYEACCEELIEGTFEGYNATILAYGQTGSGKTYTMGTGFDVNMLQDQLGIIPRAVKFLFDGVQQNRNLANTNNAIPPDFKVNAQFIELYNEEIIDLLDSTRDPTEKCRKSLIRIHEDANGGIYTVGATTKPVSSLEDTIECLKIGTLLRTTASTNMNVQSSRSHAIFTLHIRQQRVARDKSFEDGSNNMDNVTEVEMLTAKFHFVDLAGSERLKRTGATGDRAKEGISINCGLLALGNVISALGDKAKKGTHVPYRDSKLTRLLQDSLGGNSHTLMIACISPSDRDFVETLNTLKYANRARNIKNKVSINQDMNSKQLSALRAEVLALQRELAEYKTGMKSMEVSLSSVSVSQSGDGALENHMLTKEIEGLRQRVKNLQQTVESLTSRNIQLIVDREALSLLQSNGDLCEESKKLIEKYIRETEELRARYIESETSLHALRNSHRSLSSPRELKNFCLSPDEHVKEVLSIATKDLDALKNKFRLASMSIEEDKAAAEENGSEEVDLVEEEIAQKYSDDEMSDNDAHTGTPNDLDENLAALTCEISLKEKLIEELKVSQMNMKSIKIQYEQKMRTLEEKIRETQVERDRVIASLESVESHSDEKANAVKDEYERKLSELQSELKRLEVANHNHAKMLKGHLTIEKQCKTLQQELLDMKRHKVQLMNKIKEDAQKNRQTELQRGKEINQLRKDQRLKENQIKSLEAEKKQKEIVLKRKQEEVEFLRKKQRPIMSGKALGQAAKNESSATHESTRPKKPMKFSNKSSKVVWNDIEKSITSLVSKKQTLSCLERDMKRWMKQRNHLRRKLEALRKRDKGSTNREDLKKQIEMVEDNISYVQENIILCQNNIMQLEEGKEEDGDVLKSLNGCSPTQVKYLLEHAINSLVSKGLIAVEKEAENKELSAKLHQMKMDSTYQRDMLQILIQDKENIDIDESLLSQRQDSDDEDDDEDDEGDPGNDAEPFVYSSTPIRSAEDASSTLLPKESFSTEEKSLTMDALESSSGISLGKKDKARRKTATPEELLFVSRVNPPFETIAENELPDKSPLEHEALDNLRDAINVALDSKEDPALPSSRSIPRPSGSRLATNILSRLNENLNNNKKASNKHNTAGESSQISKKKPLSASSSLGSDSLSKEGSMGSTTDNTPPVSPINNRKAGHSNVFSRLYNRAQLNSPFPAKGVIRSSSGRQSQNFPLSLCYTAFGHTKAVLSAFATDSLLFSGSKDRTAKMWDLHNGEELLTLGSHPNNVASINYSEQSGLVYTASTYLIKLWDPRRGEACIKSLTSAGLVSDSSASVVGGVNRMFTCPPGETNIVDFCISTSANNLYAAVSNIVKIWDLRMYRVVGKLTGGHQAAIMTLALDDTDTADGNICIVTGSKDHYIKVYEVMEDMTGGVGPKYNLEPPHYDGIQSLCLKGDFLFSGSRDTCIKKWDLAAQQLRHSINNAHKDWICGLTFLPSANCLLSACRGGIMKVWNVDNCNLIGETQAHTSPINAITSNSHMIFSASNDKSIQFWRSKENLEYEDMADEF